ncbi:hypothetical protein HCO69_06225 [Pantoea sp. LS15]|uniref:hypothetical protein n=1 Tax=Enterobacterales TaxID=91347 RepID=UPI000E0E9AC2|nr:MULTISPECIES: hypothetical protein [Enterobacterales]NJQ19226.1 hypothetical protein [Pantoea sp. LS15]NKF45822.1 hypothetical protein [Pantoea sp. LS15]RDK15318.1 hypothetical protein CEJ32_06365 [Enterobacter sp. 9-2]
MNNKLHTPGSRDLLYKKIFLSISEMKYIEREIKKFNWLERTFLRKKEFYKMQYHKNKCDSNFFRFINSAPDNQNTLIDILEQLPENHSDRTWLTSFLL